MASKQGDIFLPRSGAPEESASFDQAFPEIESVDVVVQETGEGNPGLGERRFQRRSVREYINCSSHRCAGKGFALGALLRRMANLRQTHVHVERDCESREESGRPCPNRFRVDVTVHYVPDSRDSSSPFGVLAFFAWDHDWNDHHFPLSLVQKAATLLKDAGIQWVRMDFLWSDLEPTPGHFDFQRYDAIVNALTAQKRCILGALHYNPDWRSGPWNQPPETEKYITYAKAVVEHFRDRVGFWEIWNEPDHPTYWSPQDDLSAYSHLLRAVTPAIKDADPTARVVLGGIAMEPARKLRWIYEKAGRDSFDVANIHPFVNAGNLKGLETMCREVRTVMAEAGDQEKPLWITEIGCPGVTRKDSAKGWWLGAGCDEEEQRAWLQIIYQEALKWPGIDKIFWAFLRDTFNHFKDDVDFFGLLRSDFSKKSSFETYRQLACAQETQTPPKT